MAGKTIERGTADRSQQHRSRSQAGLQRVRGQRIFADKQGCAPDGLAGDAELVAENFSDGFQNADGFVGNFRSNAVAGQGGEVEKHGGSIVWRNVSRRKLVVLAERFLTASSE